MSKVIIFGIHDFASLAHYYLEHDSAHKVACFSVTRDYMPQDTSFEGVPVVPFEDIENSFEPSEFAFIAPMSHRKMNRLRENIYQQIRRKGYKLISYVSSKATVLTTDIGDNCFILEDNTIQPFVTIGNNVVLWSGNHIGHHSTIKDHVMFTSHVVLSGHCIVEPYSFFGVNSTIRDGLHIAEGSFIAMGTCVMQNTEPWGVYKGNPAEKAKLLSSSMDL